MPFPDLSAVTTAAIILTPHVAAFPDALEKMLATVCPSVRSYVLVHNSDQKTIPIELIRELKQSSVFSLGEHERQEVVLLWAELLSVPAQQALLKVLEEPPARTRFWLVTDVAQSLLATVRSRCVQITLSTPEDEQHSVEIVLPKALREVSLAAIAQANYSQLITLAAKPKDRDQAKQWCQYLLQSARSDRVYSSHQVQQALLQALEQLQQNGNGKLVLEHCFFHIKATSAPSVPAATVKN